MLIYYCIISPVTAIKFSFFSHIHTAIHSIQCSDRYFDIIQSFYVKKWIIKATKRQQLSKSHENWTRS